MSNQPSPYDIAMNPPEQTYENFGQVLVNAWFCMWVPNPALGTNAKGQPKKEKLPYNPDVKDANGQSYRRNTAIEIKLDPITDKQFTGTIERNYIAEFGEWVDVVLPSLKDIGVMSLQELNMAWVRAEMVPTGQTYTNGNGETKNSTTFKFIEVYPNEQACRAAYQAARGSAPVNGNGNGHQAQPQPQPANGAANGGDNSRERETAEKFLKPYVTNAWRKANGDIDKTRAELATMIAGQALLARYFTVDSPEVLELLMAQAT